MASRNSRIRGATTFIHTCIPRLICGCVCIYTYIYICVYIYIYVCIYVNMYMSICIYIHTHIYIHIHTYIHIRICTYIHAHTYIYTCTYTYIYTYIYLYINQYLCVFQNLTEAQRWFTSSPTVCQRAAPDHTLLVPLLSGLAMTHLDLAARHKAKLLFLRLCDLEEGYTTTAKGRRGGRGLRVERVLTRMRGWGVQGRSLATRAELLRCTAK